MKIIQKISIKIDIAQIIPMLFADPADYDRIDQEDEIEFENLLDQIPTRKVTVKDKTKDFSFEVTLDLSDNEVEVVLAVVNEYLNEGKDIPCEVMKYVVQELNKLEENYNKTINDLMNCNSLVVKMEQLFNLIGTIGTISIEDEDKLDKTLFNLENYVKSIKD